MEEQRTPVRQRLFLREWREHKGLSLADMARQTPFGKSTLSRVETGKIPYYADILDAYARVVGCEPYTLLQRPPGGPEEWFSLVDQLLAQDRAAELVDLIPVTKILVRSKPQNT